MLKECALYKSNAHIITIRTDSHKSGDNAVKVLERSVHVFSRLPRKQALEQVSGMNLRHKRKSHFERNKQTKIDKDIT